MTETPYDEDRPTGDAPADVERDDVSYPDAGATEDVAAPGPVRTDVEGGA